MSKPCDADTLKSVVARACSLHDLMEDPKLQQLVQSMETVPALPKLYMEVVEELKSPDCSIKRIGDIISKDIGMTAKVLQLVSSSFFGVRRQINSPTQAVVLLGVDTVRSLVLSVGAFSQFDLKSSLSLSLDALWKHCMSVGSLANKLAKGESLDGHIVDQAVMVGLLHDIGKLVLAFNLPAEYSKAVRLSSAEDIPIWRAEREVFGSDHALVGAYLLGLWGLNDNVVEALAFHHNPSKCIHQEFSMLTLVHVANVLDHEAMSGQDSHLDTEYLSNLGLADRLATWRQSYRGTNGMEDDR